MATRRYPYIILILLFSISLKLKSEPAEPATLAEKAQVTCSEFMSTVPYLIAAGEEAVNEKKPWGIEIEFVGDIQKVSAAIAAQTNAVVSRQILASETISRGGKVFIGKYDNIIEIFPGELDDSQRYELLDGDQEFPKLLTFEEAQRLAESLLFGSIVKVLPLLRWDVINKVGRKHIHEVIRHYGGKLYLPDGRVLKMSVKAAKAFVLNIQNGSEVIFSNQVFRLDSRAYGALKLIPEITQDGAYEFITDHRAWFHPNFAEGLLKSIYETGAIGTHAPDGVDLRIGVHISVTIEPKNLRKLFQIYFRARKVIYGHFKPSPSRRVYIKPFDDYFISQVFDTTISDEDFISLLQDKYDRRRSFEINISDALNGGKRIEFRIFNTAKPEELNEAIMLCLGMVHLAEK